MFDLAMAIINDASMGFTAIVLAIIGGPTIVFVVLYLRRPSPMRHVEVMDSQAKQHEKTMFELDTERVVRTQVHRLPSASSDALPVIENRITEREYDHG